MNGNNERAKFMEKKSSVRKAVVLMGVHFILLMIVFFSYLFFSYRMAAEDLTNSMENLIQVYGRELGNQVENADMLLERLILDNVDYDQLQSEDEATRYYASVRLKNFLEDQTAYGDYVDAVMIADSMYGICLDYENNFISYEDKLALRNFISEGAYRWQARAEWTIAMIGAESYVYKMYIWQGRAVGVFISVEQFMKTVQESDLNQMTMLLLDHEGRIWGTYGEHISGMETGMTLGDGNTDGGIVRAAGYELGEGRLEVRAYAGAGAVFGQIRLNMVLILIVLSSLVAYSVLMLKFVRRELLFPVSAMQKTMTSMRDGDYTLRICEEFKGSEFTLLKQTFNKLMDEIVNLRIQSYEKQIDLQETELRCVRLQIRPHFFLNAMATISSLSQRAKNREIQEYITALSKNIRYMFRSGLHTVALGEEIRHIENYFEMQELNYPNCVFYYIDIPEELEEWRIPQMLIHTVIENEYKYAVAMDQTLTILIRAEERMENGERMLCLQIEDDGGGYPDEVLKNFAPEAEEKRGGKEGETTRKTGERIGLRSIRRMLELMYERKELFEISNITPHGCRNVFYIPENPVQEVKETEETAG